MIDFNPLTGRFDDKGHSLATLDIRYVNVTGDTMTGGLTIEPDTDTLTALVVNDTDSNNVLTVDTIHNRVVVTSGTTGQSTIGAGLIVNNDSGSGAINDFQVNSDTLTVLFVDASANTLAIGVDTTFNDGKNIVLNTTTGTQFGTATGQKLSFWGVTPVVQQVLATGAGATVDNVISLLQTLGLCKQA